MSKEELIEKYKIQAQTLLDLINHPENTEAELDKLQACRRFVSGFLSDLHQQAQKPEPEVQGSVKCTYCDHWVLTGK